VMQTRAAVLEAAGARLTIDQLTFDEPRSGEVLVRLGAAGVCHSDYHVATGEWQRPMPVVLGHEGAGVIDTVGPGVSTLRPGDRVVLSWTPNCGHCRYCVTGRPVLCARPPITATRKFWRAEQPVNIGAGVGAFSEYCVVPESGAIKVHDGVPFEIAAIIGCAVMTGIGAVTNTVQVRPGSSVLVIGCGGVGLAALLGCGLAGAGRVIAADISVEKLELARRLGATDVIDPRVGGVPEQVRDILRGDGVDYAIEAIGLSETIEAAFESLAPGGTAVVVGQVPDGVRINLDPMTMSDREKTIRGSNYGSARPLVDFPHLVELYMQGRLQLDPLISRRIKLEQIDEAFEDIRRGEGTRSVVIYD